MKKLNFLTLLVLVFLNLFGVQAYPSQAADKMAVSLVQPDGSKKAMMLNPDQPLSQLRVDLLSRGVNILPDDRFEAALGEISPRDEMHWTIRSAINNGNVLSFKLRGLTPQRVFDAFNASDPVYNLIEKVYLNSAYSSGIFQCNRNGATYSTLPYAPRKKRDQAVLSYNDTPIPERVLRRVVPGQDGRIRIQDTTAWPHSIHAHLGMKIHGDTYMGSGVIVGPHHLLTCAHCVYKFDEGAFFEEISVYPALNDAVAPFNKVKATRAYMFKAYQDQGDERFDMALLLLSQSIGDYTGWGGLLSAADADLYKEEVHITGYPGDRGNGKQMWSMSHRITAVRPEAFDYEIDTYGGQSGSPVWINKWAGMPVILGVHTLGGNDINSGVRLSAKKFEKIVQIIRDTYVLNSDVDGLYLGNRLTFMPIAPKSVTPLIDVGAPVSTMRSTAALSSSRVVTSGNSSGSSSLSNVLSNIFLGSSDSSTPSRLSAPPEQPSIPLVAKEYETIYERFFKGFLMYRPEPASNAGIPLLISKLENPLGGTFNLSQCEDVGRSFSISTGYRKGKKPENANKIEVWICPRFLIERNIKAMPKNFQDLFKDWNEKAEVGIFWAWGGWELTSHDYLITKSMDELSNNNLHYLSQYRKKLSFGHLENEDRQNILSKFYIYFNPENYLSLVPKAEPKPVISIPPLCEDMKPLYERFLKGLLIYRPKGDNNDAGMVTLPIMELHNPLEGTFDLSCCGDTGNYLSISTGYRKAKNPENKGKIEIWFAPRIVVQAALKTTAQHFQKIFDRGEWKDGVDIGIFWNWWEDDLEYYDHLTSQTMDKLGIYNLNKNWRHGKTHHHRGRRDHGWGNVNMPQYAPLFTFHL